AVAFFFFQEEDGIRDGHVTGVQTCALPIWPCWRVRIGAGEEQVLTGHQKTAILDQLKKAAAGEGERANMARYCLEVLQGKPANEIGRASCRGRGEMQGVGG